MLQVKQIVNDILTSNTFVVFDDEYDYCWLIDIGEFDKIKENLPSGMSVRGVFLTHTHFDHIYGINDLCMTYLDCVVYTSEYGKEALLDDKKNLSRYHEQPIIFKGKLLKVVGEGEELDLYPGVRATVTETPGHCPSCLTYIIGNWIFSGDSFIPGVKVVTKLPKGDRLLAKHSVDKILQLSQGRIICPGHGKIE